MRFLPILLLPAVALGACVSMAGCGDDGGGIYIEHRNNNLSSGEC